MKGSSTFQKIGNSGDANEGYAHMHLVCMLASVIRDTRRLRYFRLLLDSIAKQVLPPKLLMISIYVDPTLMSEDQLGELVQTAGCPVQLRIQTEAKRQFAQIREMMERFEERPTHTFIMFSDDDDLWNPMRCYAYYANYASCLQGNLVPVKQVAFLVALERTDTNSIPCAKCQHLNENNVDAMITCGCLSVCLLPLKPESHFGLEYHEYAVRPIVLRKFLGDFPDLVERNRFADVQFAKEISHFLAQDGGNYWRYGMFTPPHWLYYYRKCDPSYAAATRPIASTTAVELTEENMTICMDYWLDAALCPHVGPKWTNIMIDKTLLSDFHRVSFYKAWYNRCAQAGLSICAHCLHCGHDFKRCSRCKTRTYCSESCQKQDWQVHKFYCGKK